MIAGDAMTGGFADPVFQSQAVFRKVLDAFARPGTVVEIPDVVQAPAPLHMPAAAFIAAFADAGTLVHLDAAMAASKPAVDWIRFHTDAPVTAEPSIASFAVVADPAAMVPLSTFAVGSAEYPDRSTTVVIQVDRISRETGLSLEGPGIEGFAELSAHPLPPAFVDQMAENRALYPRGVDVVLASPTAVAVLPRSTRVSAGRSC
jgi:alpha-D-ribose 1-methylphosphonate 5-triphosphate synthase subunit PhnH